MDQRPRPTSPGGKALRRIAAVAAGLVLLLSPASAQFYNRGPNLDIRPRMPNINPGATLNPSIHYSPNIINVGPTGMPPRLATDGQSQSGAGGRKAKKKATSTVSDDPFVPREVVIEIDGTVTDAQAAAIGRRHRIVRLESFSLPLVGGTLMRWRIPDSRSVGAVVRELVADNTIKSAQPNFRFILQGDERRASEGDPAQYALAKLHLPEAHLLTRGEDVVIAVIDSGIDGGHPELAGAIASTFDAGAGKDAVHTHGTGIAGVIASHARLMGGAPAAKLIAIRAFAPDDRGAGSTSFVLIRSLDFAVSHGARIINMSFAGPQDPLLAKGLSAAAGKGIVLVAASGNAGAKSPPLFPAADPHVIAVSAADASDAIFAASNRGAYVAACAPGVDILTAAPNGKYQVVSGTSFAAAYASAVAALVLARNPSLPPSEVRDVLTRTARDLGAHGRDDMFGAGELDALAAATAAAPSVTTASEPPVAPNSPERPRAPGE